MAAHPGDGGVVEQPRRRALTVAGVVAAALLVVVVAWRLAADGRGAAPDHLGALPIPGEGQRVVVEVLNASGRAGLARAATRRLRHEGIDVVYFGNADTAVAATRVLARRGSLGDARTVQSALGVGEVLAAPDTLRRVDVTVLVGPDFPPGGR